MRLWMKCMLLFTSIFAGVVSIDLKNGGYENINIVIQDSVEENDRLLERIKSQFTAASQLLFEATNHHVYFGQINIIIPKTWTVKPEYTLIPTLSAFESYITIEEGGPKTPHTRQTKDTCGVQALYIYLPPSFLLTEGKTNWGYHDNVIVHEWGHFRWGLFDEYGIYKRFYLKDREWKPVRCSESLDGTIGIGAACSPHKSLCQTGTTTSVMHSKCRLCPDEVHDKASPLASLMAYQWVDGVSLFCDNADDESVPINQRHNKYAPSQQNLKCDYRSAWEVMREHDDFKSSDPLPISTNTTPEFKILRETDGYRVFVLDVSGSMSGELIINMRDASKFVIEGKIPTDSWLGIVLFSSSAYTVQDIIQISSDADRNQLIAALPQSAGGGTCIGCGIDEALRIMKRQRSELDGSEIVIISDGGNNEGDLNASIQRAVDANVKLITISVSQAADPRMIDMAQATGGYHISYLKTNTISFASAFAAVLSRGATSHGSEAATISSESVEEISNSVTFNFDIDSSVGKNTSVIVLLRTYTSISIEVTDPNGVVHTQNTTSDSITLKLHGLALPGKYYVMVNTSTASQLEYHVTSVPVGNGVIRIEAGLSSSIVDFSLGKLPAIIAVVMKGKAPLLNAVVTAILETGSSSCNITLLDNGADPDDNKNDGTYAASVPKSCLRNGRISTKVYAQGKKGSVFVLTEVDGAGSSVIDEDIIDVLNDSFQRVTLTEEMIVSNYDASAPDITAPGRITDVTIVDIAAETTQYGESRNFTITWTATGDDTSIGQATEYELRISDDLNALANNFSAADLLDVVNGNFTPKAAGQTEYIRIEIDAEESYTSTTYFAIKAKDNVGNAGAVSNIVSILVANGYRVKIEGDIVYNVTEEEYYYEEESASEEPETNWTGLAVGLSCAVVIVIITIVAVAVYKKRRLSNQSQTGEGQTNMSMNLSPDVYIVESISDGRRTNKHVNEPFPGCVDNDVYFMECR